MTATQANPNPPPSSAPTSPIPSMYRDRPEDGGAPPRSEADRDAGSLVAEAPPPPVAKAAGDAGAVTVDETQQGKTIELAKGRSLVLLLGANATTGYDWEVTKAPPALGTPALGYIQGADVPGAAGKRRITWSPSGPLPAGEHVVELAYRRSFEAGKPPFKTFMFRVRAAP